MRFIVADNRICQIDQSDNILEKSDSLLGAREKLDLNKNKALN